MLLASDTRQGAGERKLRVTGGTLRALIGTSGTKNLLYEELKGDNDADAHRWPLRTTVMKKSRADPAKDKVQPLIRADQADIDKLRFPDLADLMSRLHFSTSDGRIWLDDHRMLLVHARALGSMRREMIDTLGFEVARRLLTRMGYQAGTFDAQMARKVRSKTSSRDMFVVGPQMHCLEGIGLSEPVRLDFDVERGEHYGEFLWTHQVEDEEHVRYFSIGTEPSCWMQVGYASGYSTEFMGRQILYREVECQSMGQAACRIVGKPVEVWDDEAVQDMQYLMPAALRSDAPKAAVTATATRDPVLIGTDTTQAAQAVGISLGFNSALHMVQRVAPTNATVLFLGESGVGKEVFARMLHRLSSRNHKPFVAVNCAAIPETLIESELFGVERGAYTGATQSRAGRFERADGGTLFLDEIGTLSAGAQGNLLRALQEGEIERLGDTQTRHVDVRVIAATNVDLREATAAGRFREDLFFRLNVFPIRVPPLRERREDIALLMTHFLGKFNRLHGRRLTGFTQRAVDAVMSYDWPGNIRELENVIERGVILAAENMVIDAPQLFTSGEQFNRNQFALGRDGALVNADQSRLLMAQPPDLEIDRVSKHVNNLLNGIEDDSKLSLDDIETMLLKQAVTRAHGNVAAAARLLGITRPAMVYRLKSRGILHHGE
jgi:two-component system, NtrC family, response regulator HydG